MWRSLAAHSAWRKTARERRWLADLATTRLGRFRCAMSLTSNIESPQVSPLLLQASQTGTRAPFSASTTMSAPDRVDDAGGAGGTIRPELAVDEEVMIVDEQNNVVGKAPREQMRRERLLHRATFIFVQNTKGQFIVQKRTMLKDYCPGYYDTGTGGVVQAGEEDMLDSARRELDEEIGVVSDSLKHCFDYLYEDDMLRCWCLVFDCKWDGDVKLQEEEVEAVEYWTADEIFAKAESKEAKFCPDGLLVFRKYIERCVETER